MPLRFELACQPLLLGALPHRSAAQALAVSRHYAGVLLTWPQLPQRSFREQNYVQSALGFPGLVVDTMRTRIHIDRNTAERDLDRLELAYLESDVHEAALSFDDAAGLGELCHQNDAAHGALALKGQLIGPISLAAQLVDEHERPLIYHDMLFDALAQHLRLRAAWQEAQLRQLADTTIICLDEPFLEAVGLPFLPLDWERARYQIDEVFGGIQGCKALFAGGAVDWTEALKTSVDLIIADVFNHSQALVTAAPTLAAFIKDGGSVGMGLIPSDEDSLSHITAQQLIEHALGFFGELEQAGVTIDRLVRQAVISSSGTLGRLSIAMAERALQLISEVSEQLRARYQLNS